MTISNMINNFPNYEMYIKLIKTYSNSDEYIKSILMPLMFDHKFDKIDHKLITNYQVQTIQKFNENIDLINEFITENIKKNKTVIICVSKQKKKSISKHLNMKIVETTLDHIELGKTNLVINDLNEGFIYQDFVILTANELFIETTKTKSYRTKFKYGSKIKDINSKMGGD